VCVQCVYSVCDPVKYVALIDCDWTDMITDSVVTLARVQRKCGSDPVSVRFIASTWQVRAALSGDSSLMVIQRKTLSSHCKENSKHLAGIFIFSSCFTPIVVLWKKLFFLATVV